MNTPPDPPDRRSDAFHHDAERRADADRATAIAVETALRNAKVDDRLNDTTRRLDQISGAQVEMAKTQREVQRSLSDLKSTIDTTAAVTKALADKGISTRQFYLGLGSLALMLAALLAGTGHL